jgi:drug/metabolite transporter (DMT)-like permease
MRGIIYALLAAILFGASTPAAKELLLQIDPLLLAGLFYLGSGLGLTIWMIGRRAAGPVRRQRPSYITGYEVPWLIGTVIAGGIIGPALLMYGHVHTGATATSLLLNFEGVFTALIAWTVFRENVDYRIALGFIAILLGGVILSWSGGHQLFISTSSLCILGACLCWGIDNNLTRKISGSDPVFLAAVKGVVAGISNIGLAISTGSHFPPAQALLTSGVIGFVSYGCSLVCFILALSRLGAARTGAYFATAPFAGAVLSIWFLHEPVTGWTLMAGGLMAVGVTLHILERHEHEHSHFVGEHSHAHIHDEHHQHEHTAFDPPGQPHTHMHGHEQLIHTHPHFPDLHHQHDHGQPNDA